MKKIFTRGLCICMVAALLVNIAVTAFIQMLVSGQNSRTDSLETLASVKERLAENDKNIAELTKTVGENNLAKARAFADMLAADPGILEGEGRLEEILDRLMVYELNVIDENGTITHSTVDEYIGFDMASGEQSGAFVPILSDPSLEIVQEPQVNVVLGILVQYIGTARRDGSGFVQVGIRPEVLENMLKGTQIDVVLKDIEFGKNGFVYAADSASGEISAFPDEKLIGTGAEKAGIPLKAGQGTARINGVSGKYVSEEYNGMYIGTFLPLWEYYREPLTQIAVMALSVFLIFAVLLYIINRMLDRKIISGIQTITESVKKISEGDFDIVIDQHDTPEFSMLGSSVNRMVESIRDGMEENRALIARQDEDMADSLHLIENIRQVCSNLDGVSSETLATADAIHNGTSEQEQAVRDLSQMMDSLVRELGQSAGVSESAASAALAAAQTIRTTGEQMKTLEGAMGKISSMSEKIGEIIGEINSIAQQTNMLSLNASIEAARVGDSGKGFAVVAAQVGSLAARSAHAARQTSELITNSINAVEEGRLITEKTAQEFAAAVTEIEEASHSVSEVAGLVKQNAQSVTQAVQGLGVIENVVEKNIEISKNSKDVSVQMADEAGKLLDLIE
ncbi:MAG: methyl-accepting chemotaxis protein [Eubacterium sp.]|jgi:methyl-accepting chemotaxis protein|nr:methyl-accepting chemotaxis protein [Eubacterium sp.]